MTTLVLTLVLSYSEAKTMNPVRRCAIALTAAVAKSPRLGLAAWRHFGEDTSDWTSRPTARSRRASLEWRMRALSYSLDRPVDIENVVAIARGLIADRGTSAKLLSEIAFALADVDGLPNAARLIADLRAHPHLDTPAHVLQIAANPTNQLTPTNVADLVMSVLEAETREDSGANDVPYSARPAIIISRLQIQGRLRTGDFGRAFVHLIDNPRADAHAMYWILGFLEHWAKSRYVYGGALPPPDLARTLVDKARARVRTFRYDQSALVEFIDVTERLLGVPARRS